MSTALLAAQEWQPICHQDELAPFSGAAVRLKGRQIALYRTGHQFFALDNFDPFSRANVLARGIVGDLGGKPVVASPMYKQHFDLRTGQCLEDPAVSVGTWPVHINDGHIFIGVVPET